MYEYQKRWKLKSGSSVRFCQPKLLIKIENTRCAWHFVRARPVTLVYTAQSNGDSKSGGRLSRLVTELICNLWKYIWYNQCIRDQKKHTNALYQQTAFAFTNWSEDLQKRQNSCPVWKRTKICVLICLPTLKGFLLVSSYNMQT